VKANNRLLAVTSIALSVALLLGAFAVVWLAVPRQASPAAAQEQPEKTPQITVRGSGSIVAKPDIMVVNIGVSIQEPSIKAAQDKVSSAISAMEAKLKAAGLTEKDYRTVQYNVGPVTTYEGADKGVPGTPKVVGFLVTNILEVTIRDIDNVPTLLQQLVDAGANTVYNMYYGFSDPQALANQAYDKALQDAQAKATRVATLSNLQLGKILNVTEASANPPVPYGKDMGAGGAGPFYPGQQTIQVDVIVTYEATSK
jgi:uncharacterized protein YggE